MGIKRTISLQDAVRRVPDGSSILLFPGHESAAIAFELLRQGRKGLTLITPSYCFTADLLVRGGAVRRVLSGGHDGWSCPADAPASIAEVPCGVLRSQLSAALSGVPGLLADIPAHALDVFPEFYRKADGFDGCLAAAITPDFAMLHAARAGFSGSVQLDPAESGLSSTDLLLAGSAKQPLVSVEQIVTAEAISMNAGQTILSEAASPLLVETPYGAYPGGYPSRYAADEPWLAAYRSGAHPRFPESGDWARYLQQIGFLRLMELATNRRGE